MAMSKGREMPIQNAICGALRWPHFLSHGVLLALLLLNQAQAAGARIKDIASIQGVRGNPLIGYGVVAGLDSSGDQVRQVPFTQQSVSNMLAQLGVTVDPEENMQLKNVAAVMVTATLPAFARPGQTIDVVVSSLGNAKNLRGGTLLMTPLKGVDGQVYAIAQGNLLVGGAGASSGGSSVQVNQLNGGRISNGAIVERSVPSTVAEGGLVLLGLHDNDFGTAENLAVSVNQAFGVGTAEVLDARAVQVRVPTGFAVNTFLSQLENLPVQRAAASAKVIINARTGSVVMNQTVTIEESAVAHGNISVVISSGVDVSQPQAPLAGGQTVLTPSTEIRMRQDGVGLKHLKTTANLADVVNALNALGATPQDLLSILQAMQSAGALQAELEII
jgi:flagellar P-ring protein precursor FlgI